MEELCLPIYINEHWRVSSDGIVWILERSKDTEPKGGGWKPHSYHRQKEKLLARIERTCGHVDPRSRELLESFPEAHP